MVFGHSRVARFQLRRIANSDLPRCAQVEKTAHLRGIIKNDCMSPSWQIFPVTEEFTMAEINKLSVGKVLDKLRSNDEQKKTKDMQREEQLKAIDEELQRLRRPGQRDGG